MLKAANPPPPISFERIPDENGSTTLAYYENNKQKMVFNSQRVAEFIRGLDPATLDKLNMTSFLDYRQFDENQRRSLLIVPTADVDGLAMTSSGGVGFRVTFSVDSLDRYR